MNVITLSDEDAKNFVLFMEHYDTIKILIERGVFDQKKAAITLHFDHNGVLQTLQRADFLYSRQFDNEKLVDFRKV